MQMEGMSAVCSRLPAQTSGVVLATAIAQKPTRAEPRSHPSV